MTINDARAEITKNRIMIQEHEETIMVLIRHSLEIAKSVNSELIDVAEQRYDFTNGLHFMDEEKSNVELNVRIDALDNCIGALSETLRRMRSIRDYLGKEGEF